MKRNVTLQGRKLKKNRTHDTMIGEWIGQHGERRNSYSVAVIDGIMRRKSRIFVGDSIDRKPDTSRLNKEEDAVVYLSGARIDNEREG